MGLFELWRITDPDPRHRLSPPARGRPGTGTRFEVRVCGSGTAWMIRPGIDGPVHRVGTAALAHKQARELARVAWVDDGLLSCVKVLSPDGTWVIDAIFGVDAPLR